MHANFVPAEAPALKKRLPGESRFHRNLNYALWSSLVLSRTADWVSTEEMLRRPIQLCHEVILPDTITRNKYGFGLFEAASAGGEIYLSHRYGKRHPWILHAIDAASFAATSLTAIHNYDVIEMHHRRTLQVPGPVSPANPIQAPKR
jgi:hypothetical protein